MTLLLLLACTDGKDTGAEGVAITDVVAEVSPDVATVVTVRWTTDEPVASQVRYSFDGKTLETPLEAEPATEHQALLLGIPGSTEVQYQVVVPGSSTTEPAGIVTGGLPAELPTVTTEGDGQVEWMVAPLIGAVTGPVVFSPEGEIVWYHLESRELDVYRARLAGDGSGIVYNAASVSGDPSADSEIVKVSWDGSVVEALSVPLLAHDFVELPDGSYAAIVVEYRDDGAGGQIRGDQIVEVAPSGEQTVVWSAWDCFDPATTPGDDPVLGWTFANALDYDPVEDAYYLGIRNFSSITRIDRATGACTWVLGRDAATIPVEDEPFKHQHQFDVLDGSILVFDNTGTGTTASRVMEYAFDPAAGTATHTWGWEPDPAVYSFVLGDVERLEDGDTFATFSVAGQLDRVNPDGSVAWSLNTALGYAIGFMTLPPSLYE